MRTVLATETLKTGEQLTIECVLAPDELRGPQIRPLLAHKPPNYRTHIEAALAGACDTLETRFYIGLLNDAVVGNIMTVESNGIGIFGHVHTREDQRRKGICDAIMRHQMEDFRQRNGHVLLLGTGYQSPAYRIYEKHGFLDWPTGQPGLMRYDTEPQSEFEGRFFAPAAYTAAPARWQHWPLVALFAAVPTPVYLRSLTLNVWGVSLLEGPYCQFFYHYGQRPETRASVLQSATGAAVAMATCVPDKTWRDVALLDLFAHPNVNAEAQCSLLESLVLPEAPVHCYADTRDIEKITALERFGFERAATLPGQFREQEQWRDALLYARR